MSTVRMVPFTWTSFSIGISTCTFSPAVTHTSDGKRGARGDLVGVVPTRIDAGPCGDCRDAETALLVRFDQRFPFGFRDRSRTPIHPSFGSKEKVDASHQLGVVGNQAAFDAAGLPQRDFSLW